MTYTCSYDYEIMQLPFTGGTLYVLPNVTTNWVIIKVLYRCLRRYLLGWHISRLGFVTPIVGEVSLGPLGNAHHLSHASIANNDLVAGWCITVRVKRLARDSIVGISIPSSISLPASLFTRFVIHHLTTNSLVAMLARLMWCALPRGPRDTSPTIGVTNPNLEIRQPNKYLWRHL